MNRNAEMLHDAMKQKANSAFISAKEKLLTMAVLYPNLIRHRQKSKNFGLLGGILLVEFLTYENGDPLMPGVSYSEVVHPPN